MASQFNIPAAYGYVLAAASASTLISIYHSELTIKFRKASKIPYPNAYATAAEAKENVAAYRFNCAQRAHANFGDNYPSFLVSLLVAGLAYPQISAGLGLAWTVGRFLYARGYTRAVQDTGRGRYQGGWWPVPHVALMLMAGFSSYKVIYA